MWFPFTTAHMSPYVPYAVSPSLWAIFYRDRYSVSVPYRTVCLIHVFLIRVRRPVEACCRNHVHRKPLFFLYMCEPKYSVCITCCSLFRKADSHVQRHHQFICDELWSFIFPYCVFRYIHDYLYIFTIAESAPICLKYIHDICNLSMSKVLNYCCGINQYTSFVPQG